jgi:hypothetical protein
MSCPKALRPEWGCAAAGVRWCAAKGQWIASIYIRDELHQLGCFDTQAQAAKAYDAHAKMFHKGQARLNFPKRPDKRKLATLRPRPGEMLSMAADDDAQQLPLVWQTSSRAFMAAKDTVRSDLGSDPGI